MADVHTKAQRSYNMSRIRSRDTKPEMLVRSFLHGQGYRYRLHSPQLPGRPDLVLPRHRTVIFIHGCFWHGHARCRYFKLPATNTQWWADKIARNQHNDKKAAAALRRLGWRVITVWECRLRKDKLLASLHQLLQKLQ